MVAAERDRPSVQARRAEFIEKLKDIDPARLVFLDESGCHIGMARTYGRALRGHRLHHAVPRNRGTVLTMIGALTLDGVEAMMTNVGGTNAAVFRRFVDEHLVPILREGDVVVMDNLGAHHATGIREAIEATGALVIYQPPYSPDLNAIELCWSKMKSILRKLGARTVRALRAAVRKAVHLVTLDDAEGWFDHCGYRSQPT